MVVLGGYSFLEPVCLYKVWEWQRKPVMEVGHKKWGQRGAARRILLVALSTAILPRIPSITITAINTYSEGRQLLFSRFPLFPAILTKISVFYSIAMKRLIM